MSLIVRNSQTMNPSSYFPVFHFNHLNACNNDDDDDDDDDKDDDDDNTLVSWLHVLVFTKTIFRTMLNLSKPSGYYMYH